MAGTRKLNWTLIQQSANIFTLNRLFHSVGSTCEIGTLKSEYVDSLHPGDSRLRINSRNEPCAMQQIGNIVSKIGESNNPVTQGLLRHDSVARTLEITSAGRRLIQQLLDRLGDKPISRLWTLDPAQINPASGELGSAYLRFAIRPAR